MSDILKVENVSAFYGNIQALRNVSIRLEAGEILTLIGSNGAGKSSLLKVVTGLLRPREGTVEFNGQNVLKSPAHSLVKLGMAMSPEGRQVFPKMTVHENLEMGAYSLDNIDESQLDWVLQLFPRLKERLQQQAGTLSGGEQQTLAIGRALMSKPKLLILDEPSLGLAPIIVQQIFDIIKNIHLRGVSVLLVEQNAFQALKIAKRAYVLETGSVTLEGPAVELAQDPRVREAYLGMAGHH